MDHPDLTVSNIMEISFGLERIRDKYHDPSLYVIDHPDLTVSNFMEN